MEILKGILDESDMFNNTKEKLSALSRLIDDKLALILYKYMNNESADKYIVSEMKKITGDKIDKLIYSTDKDFTEKIRRLNNYNIYCIEEPDAVLQDLDYNKNLIAAYIFPRTKKDYEVFVSLFGSGKTASLIRLNRDLFYTPREKRKNTAAAVLSVQNNIWEMLRKAALYENYKITHRLTLQNSFETFV
jgi:hypothetical protein